MVWLKNSKHFLFSGRQSTSKSVLRRFHNPVLRRGRCPSSPCLHDHRLCRLAGPRQSSTSCQPVRGSRPLLSQLPQSLQGEAAVALPTRQQNSWRLVSGNWRCSGVWRRGKNNPKWASKAYFATQNEAYFATRNTGKLAFFHRSFWVSARVSWKYEFFKHLCFANIFDVAECWNEWWKNKPVLCS